MGERRLHGVAASPGLAAGPAHRLVAGAAVRVPGDQLALAREALAAAAADLEAAAARLAPDEAAMVSAGVLMALDPALDAAVEKHVAAGAGAPEAILAAAEEHAARIAALPDANLAARAADVRSLARRAAGAGAGAVPAGAILVADDLGPADVAELDGVAGVALAGGAPTAHAAIVARALGIPMAVGLGDEVLGAVGELVVDGAAGDVFLEPGTARLTAARAAIRARPAPSSAEGPAHTADGRAIRLLVNAATAAEVRAGLAAGADGVGLLRTELSFLDTPAWPVEPAHRRALAGPLAPLRGRTATVRLLDFGGDKTPPFLAGTAERGVAIMLAAPDALAAQVHAIVAAAAEAGAELRLLLPMVENPGQVEAVRALAPDLTVGAMVETPHAAAIADALASVSDFLSIGTNDLAAETLGADRFAGRGAPAHHPAVLGCIARTARAAQAAGVPLEVCGEAAGDPVAMPLLVGLGVVELSVGAARLPLVRAWLGALDAGRAADVATRALDLGDAASVARLVRETLGVFAEAGDAAGEGAEGLAGVRAVGA